MQTCDFEGILLGAQASDSQLPQGYFISRLSRLPSLPTLRSKGELGRYFLFLVSLESFCLQFRKQPVLRPGPCLPPAPLPRRWILTWETLFTHHLWQILTLKPTLLLWLLVFWSQETSVPRWQMGFRPISNPITKTQKYKSLFYSWPFLIPVNQGFSFNCQPETIQNLLSLKAAEWKQTCYPVRLWVSWRQGLWMVHLQSLI